MNVHKAFAVATLHVTRTGGAGRTWDAFAALIVFFASGIKTRESKASSVVDVLPVHRDKAVIGVDGHRSKRQLCTIRDGYLEAVRFTGSRGVASIGNKRLVDATSPIVPRCKRCGVAVFGETSEWCNGGLTLPVKRGRSLVVDHDKVGRKGLLPRAVLDFDCKSPVACALLLVQLPSFDALDFFKVTSLRCAYDGLAIVSMGSSHEGQE
mmetsp:Transcript_15065/g.26860  ORF Transcript_15065/g.26860 Transcript_15065/m.26860 type:complete len:209 (-) Transcript_15065:187-813(-)